MLSNIDVSELNVDLINKILSSTYGLVVTFLKRKDIKKPFIKQYSFYDFSSFYLNPKKEYLLALFDSDEAINYLKNAKDSNEKISAILRSEVADHFLQNDLFINILLKELKINKYSIIDYNTSLRILNSKKYDLTNAKRSALLLNLSYDDQIKILSQDDINNYKMDVLLNNQKLLKWIFNNKRIYLSDISLYTLSNFLRETEVEIPSYLFDDIDFVYKLSNNSNVLITRNVLNEMSKKGIDTKQIEKRRKKYFDNIISNMKSDMLNHYYEFYNELFNGKKDAHNLINKYFKIDEDIGDYTNIEDRLASKIVRIYTSTKLTIDKKQELIKNILITKTKQALTTIIIDYHFEECFYNVLMDIKELLNLQTKHKKLPDDKLDLYNKILRFDYLDIKETLNLHNKLKNTNVIEMFYDDMKDARDIVNESIANYILNSKSIQKYKNIEKSNQYGVDVFEFNGEEFFALVKSGQHNNYEEPFGHSFSVIGKYGIGTFANPYIASNYIYEGLTKDQIIHVFPNDSYTEYRRNERPSDKVNVLMDIEELIKNSAEYNEVLILERGTKTTDMDKYIPELKKIALYCYDQIEQEDIEEAKDNNVGIMLINTDKYKLGNNETIRGIDQNNYEYYNGENAEKLESIRKDITRL